MKAKEEESVKEKEVFDLASSMRDYGMSVVEEDDDNVHSDNKTRVRNRTDNDDDGDGDEGENDNNDDGASQSTSSSLSKKERKKLEKKNSGLTLSSSTEKYANMVFVPTSKMRHAEQLNSLAKYADIIRPVNTLIPTQFTKIMCKLPSLATSSSSSNSSSEGGDVDDDSASGSGSSGSGSGSGSGHGSNTVVMTRNDALHTAREHGMDLIMMTQLSDDSAVCRIASYSQYLDNKMSKLDERVEKNKEQESKNKVKKVRFKASTQDQALELKSEQIIGFLLDGKQVQVTVLSKEPRLGENLLKKVKGIVEEEIRKEDDKKVLVMDPIQSSASQSLTTFKTKSKTK